MEYGSWEGNLGLSLSTISHRARGRRMMRGSRTEITLCAESMFETGLVKEAHGRIIGRATSVRAVIVGIARSMVSLSGNARL